MRQKNCSMHIYINTLKKSRITKKYPLYLKLTYNGTKIETRLPQTMDVSEAEIHSWDKSLAQFRNKKNDPRNTDIKDLQVRFDKYLRINDNKLVDPLPVVMAKVLNKVSLYKNWTVLSYCNYYLENRVKDNINLSVGTKKNYQKAVNHFSNFLIKNKITTLPLDSFKHKDAQDFEIYMGTVAKNAPSSTATNIIRLKTIFIEAINEELISRNPFAKIRLNYKAISKTPSLTISQLKDLIINEKIKSDPRLEFYYNMFLFGCFTGLSLCNIQTLSYDTLFKIGTNKLKLDTRRVKTKVPTVQVIPHCAQRIIEKYQVNATQNEGRVFPSFSGDDFREKLKLIAVHANLNINLTTKISRTTCNQLLINTGGFDVVYKRAYLGWSNASDIQDIYTNISDEVLLINTENFERYLQSHLGDEYNNI